ncbi:hypothetical protein Vretimale_13153 [Volvox reticuliferus]|uniref:Uncharacterized protein n=2 Tax=Volvox reticuliferus TaxID=1737510 RepID=A0A8J4LTS0_9CHLO|nr:hypothetical protein Vretimale_13153 [Volvox reticuliferus]
MDALEYNMIRARACNATGALFRPTIDEMQKCLPGANRRRSLHFQTAEPSDVCGVSFSELEQRYHLQDVWGHTTTPAMQTLECIQKVKEALVEGVTEDTISSGFFSVLVGVSVVAAVAVVIIWELYLRPHNHGMPLH